MARRRSATVDTSDPLSSGVMVGLTIFILGVLGVLYAVNSQDARELSATAPAATPEAATPTTVPAVPPEDTTPAGEDIDGDGDTAADGESAVEGDAAAGGAEGGPATDATDGVDAPVPDATVPDATVPDGTVPDATEPGAGGDEVLPPPVAREGSDDLAAPDDDAGGRGLFSPDDPARVPAITVSTTPRDVHVVQADLDGDGVNERVWAAIVRDQVLTRVEHVVDGRWVPSNPHPGAAADRLVALRVRDLTGDGRPEVYTRQWVATEGESLTLWRYGAGDLSRMRMAGGCYGNTNTVGITGAIVEAVGVDGATIAAICRDEGLPPQQWSSAMYVWRDGRWEFDRQQGTYG